MKYSKHVMVTCYDATFAKLIADAGIIDSVLVGDSVGMVVGGDTSTLNVTLEQMIYHVRAVSRGMRNSTVSEKKPLVIADMPVATYETCEMALRNASRLVEAGAEMIKVEGAVMEQVVALRNAGFRVCGHIGLTPQSIQDFRVQGRSSEEADRLRAEARALDLAGVELLVLEMIPAPLAAEITQNLNAKTIGIGAGKNCGGQVLVLYDLLGLNKEFNPKFLKKFADGAQFVEAALSAYASEVQGERYPGIKHSFGIPSELNH